MIGLDFTQGIECNDLITAPFYDGKVSERLPERIPVSFAALATLNKSEPGKKLGGKRGSVAD